MFLRTNKRWKNGKWHRYYSVVENLRLTDGKVVQRTVLYLGEVNDYQESAWRKTLKVFDESSQQKRQLTLFPQDQPIPADALDAISVRLSEMQLRHPRSFGDCWLGCWLWNQLGLDQFWPDKLQSSRGDTQWSKVLQLLVINRLIDPGSEFRVIRCFRCLSILDFSGKITSRVR